MTMRITGLNSGLDTEAIIKELVSAYSIKSQKYTKAQTKLSWKQDAWKSTNKKIYSLYSSVSSLRFSSAYNLKKTSVSDTTKATVTAASSAVNGTQTLKIKQLAKAGYITGGQLKSGTTDSATLGDLGYLPNASGTITVKTATGSKDISVSKDTKISDFVSELKSAGLNANYDATNRRMFVSAKESGTANDFSLVGSDANGLSALAALGLNVGGTASTEAYAGFASYALNESGEKYFVLDEDGKLTYDEEGKVVTNGTYSEAKTREYATSVVTALSNAHDAKTAAEAENAELEPKLEYAKAYQNVYNLRNNADPEVAAAIAEWEELNEKYVGAYDKTYIDDEGKTYTTEGTRTNESGATVYDYVVERDDDVVEVYTSETKLKSVQERMDELAKKAGLITGEDESEDRGALTQFKNDLNTIKYYKNEEHAAEVAAAAEAGTLADDVASLQSSVDSNKTAIDDANAVILENKFWDTGDYSSGIDAGVDAVMDKITLGMGVSEGTVELSKSATGTRVNAQDAEIVLNDATFTSATNSFTVNGLTVKALATTAEGEEITITTASDTQGIYDKVKDFLTQYNELVNELTASYNAANADGYEPLTDDEKDEMTDTEIEKWEEKIKNSLLRRDTTLSSVISAMQNAMSKAYGGKTLSAFGIKTLGYLNAAANEQNSYHIDGDADDDNTSGNADKLMAAIEADPDSVIDFMKELSSGLYSAIGKKMTSTSMSSAYTVYNDKEMASEYSDYTTTIKKWEEKLKDLEDSYYKKFSAMETALAKLQGSQSSLSGLLGTG